MNQETSFQDFFVKSFSELNFTNGVNTLDIIIVLLVTFLMGMFIFYIYKPPFKVSSIHKVIIFLS
ncbi:MAG: hypothetical protein Q9M36_01745 [Sulfurovum sp.]|nr:hypothetical protein [Sulfurovum sp.]